MRMFASVPVACGVVILLVGTAFADDALDAVYESGKALQAVPVFRATTTSTDVAESPNPTISVIEKAKPRLIRMRQESAGKREMEIISDGRRNVIRLGTKEEFEDGGRSVTLMMANIRSTIILPLAQDLDNSVIPSARVAHLMVAGHEMLGGKPATIYTCWEDQGGVIHTEKFWISDEDSLPLKHISENKGEARSAAGAIQKVDKQAETLFDYDSAIRIVLPEIKEPGLEKSAPKVTTPETAISSARPLATSASPLLCAFSFSTVFPVSAVT